MTQLISITSRSITTYRISLISVHQDRFLYETSEGFQCKYELSGWLLRDPSTASLLGYRIRASGNAICQSSSANIMTGYLHPRCPRYLYHAAMCGVSTSSCALQGRASRSELSSHSLIINFGGTSATDSSIRSHRSMSARKTLPSLQAHLHAHRHGNHQHLQASFMLDMLVFLNLPACRECDILITGL